MEVTPKSLGYMKTQLEQTFMKIQNISTHDPVLKNVSQLIQLIGRIIDACIPRNPY